jgi:hypothetical protein
MKSLLARPLERTTTNTGTDLSVVEGALPSRHARDPMQNLALLDAYTLDRDKPFKEVAHLPVQFSPDGGIYVIERPAGEMWERSVFFGRQVSGDQNLADNRVVLKVTGGSPEEFSRETTALAVIAEHALGGKDMTRLPVLLETGQLSDIEGHPRMIAVTSFQGKQSLDSFIERRALWGGDSQTLEVAISTTRGVRLLHALGVAHFDLYGRNVMLSEGKARRQGAARTSIIDFDLSTLLSQNEGRKTEEMIEQTESLTDNDLKAEDKKRFSVGVLSGLSLKPGITPAVSQFLRTLGDDLRRFPRDVSLRQIESDLHAAYRYVRSRRHEALSRLTMRIMSGY